MAIKGIIFDKDGTLFHYGNVWGKIIEDTLKHKLQLGHLSEENQKKCLLELEREIGIDSNGASYPKGILFAHGKIFGSLFRITKICTRYKLKPIKTVVAFMHLLNRADHGLEDMLAKYDFSDAIDTIEKCYKKGYILGMVTNDKNTSTNLFLEKLDPNKRISFVINGESKCRHKPHPEAAIRFCRENHISPSELCVVGDTGIDMRFAANAKAGRRIALMTGSGDRPLLESSSDALYPSISDILKDPVLFSD